MHIAEGILSIPALTSGATIAAVGVGVGLYKMDYEHIPRVAVISSAFFVASLVHVPIGPTSTHLILNGLSGLILGWAAFPAIMVALFLQAILFGFGGLTALGANTVDMALPAIISYYLFNKLIRTSNPSKVFAFGFAAGALSIILSCILLATFLFISNRDFLGVIKLAFVAHIPVMIIEGLITGFICSFIRKVRPELLEVPIRQKYKE